MRALLDVNVLIALLDAAHVHHRTARSWLAENIEFGWASCPMTQNGCVRILSQPSYPNCVSTADAIGRLSRACNGSMHAFWPDEISLLNPSVLNPNLVYGPKQLTDLYLLALAVHNGGRLLTFDQKIPITAIASASAKHLVVLA